MNRVLCLSVVSAVFLGSAVSAQGRGRPAPPASRYGYTLKIDPNSLPEGVTVRELGTGQTSRWLIANASDVPLIINERFQGDRLVTGTKLVGGKVYQYFPSGVPMVGKRHLKGWQAPFGEIKETSLRLARDPSKIYEGRKPGLSKTLPPNEAVSIPAKHDGKPYEIKVTIHYHLNPAYDGLPRFQKGN